MTEESISLGNLNIKGLRPIEQLDMLSNTQLPLRIPGVATESIFNVTEIAPESDNVIKFMTDISFYYLDNARNTKSLLNTAGFAFQEFNRVEPNQLINATCHLTLPRKYTGLSQAKESGDILTYRDGNSSSFGEAIYQSLYANLELLPPAHDGSPNTLESIYLKQMLTPKLTDFTMNDINNPGTNLPTMYHAELKEKRNKRGILVGYNIKYTCTQMTSMPYKRGRRTEIYRGLHLFERNIFLTPLETEGIDFLDEYLESITEPQNMQSSNWHLEERTPKSKYIDSSIIESKLATLKGLQRPTLGGGYSSGKSRK